MIWHLVCSTTGARHVTADWPKRDRKKEKAMLAMIWYLTCIKTSASVLKE